MHPVLSVRRAAALFLLFLAVSWAALSGLVRAGEDAPPLLRIVPGLEEPLVATATTTAKEDAALTAAIAVFRSPAVQASDFADSAKPFEAFLTAHPTTAWRTAVLTNLGIGYYHSGYFTKAAKAWEQAWAAGRIATAPQAKALADRAFGELVRMHARVGHAKELEALFADAGDRAISGSATEMVTGAHEGLWMFRNDWGTAYLCGPMALKNLLIALQADPTKIAALEKVRSGPHGFTFTQVSRLADEAGLGHRLVHRAPGQDVPVPSVVNWTMNHYAAIVGEKNGRYHLKDPTFGGGDLWVSKAAIDAESSGYFLVPAAEQSSLPWRTASAEEARHVYGMGNTGQNQTGSTTPSDSSLKDTSDPNSPPTAPKSDCGMCVADAKMMVVSLTLSDSPVGYTPPKGPPVFIRLTYNQREAYQPAVFSFFNVGPKWTLNVLSYIQDDPSAPGSSVSRYVAGGGAVDYTIRYTYNSTTGAFSPERQGQAVLVRIPATGAATSYELRMPDGSKQVFGKLDGAASSPRRIFLTQIVDAQGNALTLNYDNQLRLTTVTDATGRNTTFGYGAVNPLLVTRIADPFGRAASMVYDASGRLASITDVIGITSSFAYDAGGLINAMTTPYGTSRYSYGSGSNNSRFLEMTDPLGYTERIEFLHQAPGIPYGDPVAPAGWNNDYLYFRNTFHWDKHVYPITHTDYTKARITHWLHNPANQTSPIIESVKMPLERRVWLRYPGQGLTYVEGTTGTPLEIARVLDDNTTQSRASTYNSLGKPLTAIDPVGRKTVFSYDPRGIDLLAVQQQTNAGGGLSTIAAFTYSSQHLPLTYTDAAGQVTRYAYNPAGQLVSATNALSQNTSYSYDGLGRLLSIVNANGTTQQSRSYDGFDRVATSTDSEGYTLSYSYDALDRVTRIGYPDGTTTQYGYDKLDRTVMQDRLGRATRYAYDANRRLTAATDPLGQTTGYGYYENGVLGRLVDPKGNVTRWDIDIQSRPTAKRYANGNVETYAYEATTSRLRARTDALGQVKSYGYARDGRVTALGYTAARNLTPGVSFAYDPFFPRLAAMTDGIGTTAFQYHPPGSAGALKQAMEDGPFNNDAVAYQYDALGRVIGRTVDSAAESVAYDRIGRITNHNSALGAFSRSYLGQTNQLTGQGNGVVGTSWNYEGNTGDRRLTGITNAGLARSFTFASTPENRIIGIGESIVGTPQKNWAYNYDATDRLVAAQPTSGSNFAYGYDGADNLTGINGVPATYNAANQITSFGGAAFVYDAAGNLLEDSIRTYQWDAENRLIGIGYKTQPGQSTTLRYDGMGRRLVLTDNNQSGPNETRHLWCGETLCQARNASDQVTRRYFGEGVAIPQGNTLLYYGTDQLGSVRDLSAVQNGAKVASFDYDPYGNPIATSGRVNSDFRYAGLFSHPKSGLNLANYRTYDPTTARWLSRDPIEEQGGLNLYAYAKNNPLIFVDPNGQVPLLLIIPLVGGSINAIASAIDASGQCNATWSDIAGAAGRGFLSGAAGSLVGLGVGTLTGNPFLAGSAGALTGNLTDQILSGNELDAVSAGVATVTGGIVGVAANRLLPLTGRVPYLTSNRTLQDFGPNSIRMIGQEAVSGAVGGVVGAGYNQMTKN